MGTKFRADGTIGRVAIYEDSDDNPWSDPLTYKSRVHFHSSLHYPARVSVVTGTYNFAAITGGAPIRIGVSSATLFTHGLGFTPLVEGKWLGIGTGGADVPMCGTIPVQQASGLAAGYNSMARWVTIGADATNVYLHQMYGTAASQSLAAVSIDYEIHLYDLGGL